MSEEVAEARCGPARLVSVLVPMYNEEVGLDQFFGRLFAVIDPLPCDFEIVCVNDGSLDGTLAKLQAWARRDWRVSVIDLARNFGKEAALTAALDFARGDAAILIDADLQDPPELIPHFLNLWRDGFKMVVGVRSDRRTDSLAKRVTAWLFYAVFNLMSPTPVPAAAGDFRLMDRSVIENLKRLPERNRFMKGLFAWVGGRCAEVPFERGPRAGGRSAWNYWRLWNFALDGLTGFSTAPLRIWSYIGVTVALLGFMRGLFLSVRTIFFGVDVPGYASLAVAMLILGGLQMISLGVIGEYVGRIYLEAKQRPVYLVNDVYSEAGVAGASARVHPRRLDGGGDEPQPEIAPRA